MTSICLLILISLIVIWLIYRSRKSNFDPVWMQGLSHGTDDVIVDPQDALNSKKDMIIYISNNLQDNHNYPNVHKINYDTNAWKHVLPNLSHKFVLILLSGDDVVPDEYQSKYNYYTTLPNLLQIYSTNAKPNNILSQIPLGIDFHTKRTNKDYKIEQEKILNIYKNSPSIYDRELICIVGWNNNTSAPLKRRGYVKYDRNEYLQSFPKNLLKFANNNNRDEFWKICSEAAYVICPAGNGPDTHRLWEALILGCIAIVQSTIMDPLMKGLPVVIIDDPSSLTKEDLEGFRQKLGWMCNDPEVRRKYTANYWIDKIKRIHNI